MSHLTIKIWMCGSDQVNPQNSKMHNIYDHIGVKMCQKCLLPVNFHAIKFHDFSAI